MNTIKTILYTIISKLLPKSISKLFLTCEQSAVMLSNKDQVSFFNKIRLRMHIFICSCCSNFEKQVHVIEKSSDKLGSIKLTDEQTKKIESSKSAALNKILNK